MALDSFSSRSSSDGRKASPSHQGMDAVSLPGAGFSVWTQAQGAMASMAPELNTFNRPAGFSLPSSKRPALSPSHVVRGFGNIPTSRVISVSRETPMAVDHSASALTMPIANTLATMELPQSPTAIPPVEAEVSTPSQKPTEPAIADTQSTSTTAKTTKNTIATAEVQSAACTIDISKPMTPPSSVHLPGNGFSVWTEQSPACHALRLVSDSPASIPPVPETPSGGSDAGDASHFKVRPEPSQPKGGGGFLKWAALFLFLCALAAFLSSESGRKKVITERDGLQAEKETLTREKQGLHDNWVSEQATNAKLTEEISGLEKSLAESKASITELTAEKNGLSKTIEQLQSSLAMTVEEAKNTEMMLNKVINDLKSKNATLTSNLEQESEKLKGLDTRLSEIMSELAAAKAANEQLANEKTGLEDKVAQLQSSLDQTVKDAEAREAEMRTQLETLKKTNEELAASLAAQKEELSKVKSQLQDSEKTVVEEKDKNTNTQSQVNDLSKQLEAAVAARDGLDQEKQSLAASVAELTEKLQSTPATGDSTAALEQRIASLESDNSQSTEQIQTLTKTRDELLHRNAELQGSLEKLNGHLSKLAESEEAEESSLTKRIAELTTTNENLQQSLEKQREEFNALLRSANAPQGEPSAAIDAAAFEGAVQDLKESLSKSLSRETTSQEKLTDLLATQTSEMLNLNTKVAKTQGELKQAQGLLSELDKLRTEVTSLRTQGDSLENELAQRATHIATLNQDNTSWQNETEKLRDLLQTERLAQNKLRDFANELQGRIASLETPEQALVTK